MELRFNPFLVPVEFVILSFPGLKMHSGVV